MKLRSLGLTAALALACALPAAAQSGASLPVKDAAGATRNIAGQTDAAGGFHYRDIMEGLTAAGAPDAFLTDGAGHQLVSLFGLGGAATSAKQDTLLAALGSPLQAGGAVTVTGGATAAGQATQITSLQALATAQGAPTDAKSTATDATAASETALLKGQIDRLQAIVTALTGSLAVTGPLTSTQLGAAGLATATGQGTQLAATQALLQPGGKVDTVIAATSADRGASITAATAVTLMAANTSRRGFTLQNQGASSCWFSGVAAATADFHSLLLAAGAYFETPAHHSGTGALSIICPSATSGAPVSIYAREF